MLLLDCFRWYNRYSRRDSSIIHPRQRGSSTQTNSSKFQKWRISCRYFRCWIYNSRRNVDTFNNATPGADPYGTFLVSYSFENFKTPADDSGLYIGTSTLGSTVTCEMVHSDGTAADLFFFAEYDKILSIDDLTQNFVVSDQTNSSV